MHVTTASDLSAYTSNLTTIDVADDGFITTLTVYGPLEKSDQTLFDGAIARVSDTAMAVLLDLRRCTNCDTAALIRMIKYRDALSNRLQVVVSETGPVRRLLEISGLACRLGVVASLEQAREVFRRAA